VWPVVTLPRPESRSFSSAEVSSHTHIQQAERTSEAVFPASRRGSANALPGHLALGPLSGEASHPDGASPILDSGLANMCLANMCQGPRLQEILQRNCRHELLKRRSRSQPVAASTADYPDAQQTNRRVYYNLAQMPASNLKSRLWLGESTVHFESIRDAIDENVYPTTFRIFIKNSCEK
jgi:hypothetical protein